MKFIDIAPVHDLDQIKDQDTHMILAWLLKDSQEYMEFYINLKKLNPKNYYILDNGANESSLFADGQLMFYARQINADEIVLPDKFDDCYGTHNASMRFITEYGVECHDKNIKFMGVIQGIYPEVFRSCYDIFSGSSQIDVIGIGYRNLLKPFSEEISNVSIEQWKKWGIDNIDTLIKKLEDNTFLYTMSRVYFLKKYVNFTLLKRSGKRIHLLGLTNPIELSLYKKMFDPQELKMIRGCDSATAFQAAQANVHFDKSYGVVTKPKKLLEFKRKLSDNELNLMKYNRQIINEWMEIKNGISNKP